MQRDVLRRPYKDCSVYVLMVAVLSAARSCTPAIHNTICRFCHRKNCRACLRLVYSSSVWHMFFFVSQPVVAIIGSAFASARSMLYLAVCTGPDQQTNGKACVVRWIFLLFLGAVTWNATWVFAVVPVSYLPVFNPRKLEALHGWVNVNFFFLTHTPFGSSGQQLCKIRLLRVS